MRTILREQRKRLMLGGPNGRDRLADRLFGQLAVRLRVIDRDGLSRGLREGSPMREALEPCLVPRAGVAYAVPKKYEHLLADPLGSLARAVDVGSVAEVFICAMLAPAERKPDVIGMLVESLQRSDSVQGRATIGKMLVFLTEQKLGDDPKAWKDWWEKQKTRPAKS